MYGLSCSFRQKSGIMGVCLVDSIVAPSLGRPCLCDWPCVEAAYFWCRNLCCRIFAATSFSVLCQFSCLLPFVASWILKLTVQGFGIRALEIWGAESHWFSVHLWHAHTHTGARFSSTAAPPSTWSFTNAFLRTSWQRQPPARCAPVAPPKWQGLWFWLRDAAQQVTASSGEKGTCRCCWRKTAWPAKPAGQTGQAGWAEWWRERGERGV